MNWDAILCIDNERVCETDERVMTRKGVSGAPRYFKGSADWDDPKLYDQFSFGNILRNSLNSMGQGYSNEVVDYGKWVCVKVTYHNTLTARSSSKNFLIVFKDKGDGIVLSTHNRYRSISGVDQAASYIKATCGSLQTDTQSKIG